VLPCTTYPTPLTLHHLPYTIYPILLTLYQLLYLPYTIYPTLPKAACGATEDHWIYCCGTIYRPRKVSPLRRTRDTAPLNNFLTFTYPEPSNGPPPSLGGFSSGVLRPRFGLEYAPPCSCATFDFPQNSFVWEKKIIDSRPPKQEIISFDSSATGVQMNRCVQRGRFILARPSTDAIWPLSEQFQSWLPGSSLPGSYPGAS